MRIGVVKKILVGILSISLLMCMTGCGKKLENKYNEALGLYNEGQYTEALTSLDEIAAEELGEYAIDINWYRLAAYLGSNGEQKYTNSDDEYEVIMRLNEEGKIYTQFHLKSADSIEIYLITFLPKNGEEVQLGGKSKLALLTASLEDECYAPWDIKNYKSGDTIEWDEYTVSGTKLDGTPVDPDSEGMLISNELSVTRFVTGMEEILNESGLGITIQDMGFVNFK